MKLRDQDADHYESPRSRPGKERTKKPDLSSRGLSSIKTDKSSTLKAKEIKKANIFEERFEIRPITVGHLMKLSPKLAKGIFSELSGSYIPSPSSPSNTN